MEDAELDAPVRVSKCETPKSPPGDYNGMIPACSNSHRNTSGVKHLNPRQGITTNLEDFLPSAWTGVFGVKHLNPRQGITTSISHQNRVSASDRV